MHGYAWFKAVEVIENKRPVAKPMQSLRSQFATLKIAALHHSPASCLPDTAP